MMKQQVIYVFTHDSIGLGEDGPTHQPIEHLAGLRSIPNINVLRPCDAIETFEAWEIAINSFNKPTILALSRQNLPIIREEFSKNLTAKGGYFLNKTGKAQVTIISSGSEVSIGKDVQEILKQNNIESNLVSMPSIELFEEQNKIYKDKIFGAIPKVIIEASSSQSWYKFTNSKDLIFGVDEFGESGKAEHLYDHFGLTKQNISKEIIKKLTK